MKTREQFNAEANRFANTITRALSEELFNAEIPHDDDRYVRLRRCIFDAFLAGARSALESGGIV